MVELGLRPVKIGQQRGSVGEVPVTTKNSSTGGDVRR